MTARIRRLAIGLGALVATTVVEFGHAQTPAEHGLNPLGAIDASTLRGFRERPLFSASRRAPTPPAISEPAPAAPVAQAQPNLRLTGVIEGPEERVAVVQDLDAKETWQLRLGDRISGWLVTSIDPVAMRLTRGESDQEYRLFDAPGR